MSAADVKLHAVAVSYAYAFQISEQTLNNLGTWVPWAVLLLLIVEAYAIYWRESWGIVFGAVLLIAVLALAAVVAYASIRHAITGTAESITY